MTSNMVGPSITPSKPKGKQLARNYEESDVERSLSLKEILVEPEGIYKRTRIQTKAITTVDYNALAQGIEASDEHWVIAKSQSFNSWIEKKTSAYMVDTPEEIAKRFEEKARVQQAQNEIVRV